MVDEGDEASTLSGISQAVMNGSGHNSIWLTNRITPPIIKPTV